MGKEAFELGEKIKLRKLEYVVYRNLWDKFIIPDFDLDFSNWSVIKYLNDDASDFSDQINEVPNDSGGLYMFLVKCPVITGITEYPLYIGRAQITEGQNLRKRVKEYFQKYSKDDERPKIHTMFEYYSHDLYLAFYTLEHNEDIISIEKNIINSLILPMNDLIPDKIVKDAVKSFP